MNSKILCPECFASCKIYNYNFEANNLELGLRCSICSNEFAVELKFSNNEFGNQVLCPDCQNSEFCQIENHELNDQTLVIFLFCNNCGRKYSAKINLAEFNWQE